VIARLVVHFDVALTSQNRKANTRQRMSARKASRLAGWEAWLEAGRPRSAVPVDVKLINCRTREMDELNFGGSCKGIIDGIFINGLTPDDTPKWVSFLKCEQRPHKSHRADPTVIVEVYERQK
jgi:hypothetical protein